ncbi:MAG: PorV/PorQ family protein [Ignavibacteriae bacterium]|nr:MAG: PorV/PorQ family protein [Ignavibacteriota bacterium]
MSRSTGYRLLLMLAVLTMAAPMLCAQEATIFPFLRGTISARAAGLGGATVALTGDLSTVVLNPASLYTVEGPQMTGTFIKHVLDINSGYATYGDKIGDVGMMAVTASYTSYGSFERTDASGAQTGSFGAQDVVLAATIARELDTLISYGFTVKFLYSGIDDQASTAIALDAGLHFQIPQSRTNVGIALLNLGAQLSTYDGTSDNLPIDLRIGVNHRLKGLPLLVNASLNHLTDDVESFGERFLNFSVGGELYIGKVIMARLGYDNAQRNLSGVNVATQATGLSGGIGVNLEDVDVDYALSSLGSSALMHRISVGLIF